MKTAQIEPKIREYLITNFQQNDFDNNVELFSLGMDSVEFMMFIVYVEETFNIKVDDEILTSNLMVTVQDAIEYIERKCGEKYENNPQMDSGE